MQKYLGYSLIAIAILHQLVGLYFYQPALAEIFQAGFFNTVNPPYWNRDAAFWFLMSGGLLLLLGLTVHWMQATTGTIPVFMAWGLLLVCLFGVTMMPSSGFWLIIPVAILMLRYDKPKIQQLAA